VAALVDFNGVGGIIALNKSTYEVNNYIPVYNDTTDYTYGICHAESTSRLYLTSDDYNTNTSSLWDCKLSIPTASTVARLSMIGDYVGPFVNGATINDAGIGGNWGTTNYQFYLTNIGAIGTSIINVSSSNSDFSSSFTGSQMLPFLLPSNSGTFLLQISKSATGPVSSSLIITYSDVSSPFTIYLSGV
jgi:hypothetical protein